MATKKSIEVLTCPGKIYIRNDGTETPILLYYLHNNKEYDDYTKSWRDLGCLPWNRMYGAIDPISQEVYDCDGKCYGHKDKFIPWSPKKVVSRSMREEVIEKSHLSYLWLRVVEWGIEYVSDVSWLKYALTMFNWINLPMLTDHGFGHTSNRRMVKTHSKYWGMIQYMSGLSLQSQIDYIRLKAMETFTHRLHAWQIAPEIDWRGVTCGEGSEYKGPAPVWNPNGILDPSYSDEKQRLIEEMQERIKKLNENKVDKSFNSIYTSL